MTDTAAGYGSDVTLGYGPTLYDHVCKRLEAIRALGEPGFVLPDRIAQRPDGAVLASYEPHTAVTLNEALDKHGSFSAGECVWWASEVARLLSLLHRNGLVHAHLTASAVLLDSQGIKLSCLVEPTADPDAATASADIQALGHLLELGVKAEDAQRIGAWSEPMTSALDSARPTAAMVARALMSCAPPQPVTFEQSSVAQSVRDDVLRSQLSGASSPSDGREGAAWMPAVLGAIAGSWLPRLGHLTAVRPSKRTLGLGVLTAGVCLVAITVVPWLWRSDDGANLSSVGQRELEIFAPEEAAAELTTTRVESLAVASESGLLSVSAPTSAVRVLDLTRVLALRAGTGTALQSVDVLDVHKSASPLDSADAGQRPRLWVSVTYVLSAQAGAGAAATESVVLLLGRDAQGGWEVHAAVPDV